MEDYIFSLFSVLKLLSASYLVNLLGSPDSGVHGPHTALPNRSGMIHALHAALQPKLKPRPFVTEMR